MDPVIRRQTLADLLHRSAARSAAQARGAVRRHALDLRGVRRPVQPRGGRPRRRGVAKGTRVAVLARNSHAFAALRFALARLGAVLVPINFMLKADEVAYILRHAGATLLATDSGLAELARSGRGARHRGAATSSGCRRRTRASPSRGMTTFDALAATDGPLPELDAGAHRPGADRLHQRHRVGAQGRDAHARRGDLAVRELHRRRRASTATT